MWFYDINDLRIKLLQDYSRGGLIGNPRGVLLSGLKLWFAENNFVSHIRNWLSFPEHILFFSGTLPRPRNSIFSDMQVLGSLSFFLEISIFWFRVWPLCQNDRAEHFFQVWKKIKLSLIFLCYGEARTSLIFFIKQNKIQLGPPWKMMTNQNFHCLRNPYFFAWETILQNQSLHS